MRERTEIKHIAPSSQEVVLANEFPTDPQERSRVLLTRFNNTLKSAVFLLTPTVGQIRAFDLENAFADILSGTAMQVISKHTVRSYIISSLMPGGLIGQTRIVDEKKPTQTYYFQTESGQKYGLQAAVLGLDFEMRNKISLVNIFGESGVSSDVRAPFVRAEILQLLATSKGPLTRKEIADTLGYAPEVVGIELEDLAGNGFVEYKSALRDNKSIVEFEVSPDTQLPLPTRRQTSKDAIVNICQQLADSQIPITTGSVRSRLINGFVGQWRTEQALNTYLSHVLNDLAKRGFLRKPLFIGREKLSTATITDKGKVIVDEFIQPLHDIAEDKPGREYVHKTILLNVLRNLREYVANSADLYFPHSRNGGRSQDTTGILKTIQAAKRGISIRQISEKLGLPKHLVRKNIAALRAGNLIKVDSKGVVRHYSPKKNGSEKRPKPEQKKAFIPDPFADLASSAPYDIEELIKIIPHNTGEAREVLDSELRITREQRHAIITYYIWGLQGSFERTAKLLGITVSELKRQLNLVHESELLTDIYDRMICAEEIKDD